MPPTAIIMTQSSYVHRTTLFQWGFEAIKAVFFGCFLTIGIIAWAVQNTAKALFGIDLLGEDKFKQQAQS